MSRPKSDLSNRLWSYVDIKSNDECWEWTGYTLDGYGLIRVDGHNIRSHRLAWEITNGPILDNKLILHKCDNRKCCNPNHLYCGTQADNILDMCHRCPNPPGYMRAILSKEDIIAIRSLKGRLSSRKTGKKFSIGATTVLNIWNSKVWMSKGGKYV
jgi:hypothetical protein